MNGPLSLCSEAEEVVEHLRAAEDLGTIQQIVRTAARRCVRADGATFVLREVDQCFYADEDAVSPLWKGQRFPLTNCISGWAMLHEETVAISDITEDGRIPLEAYRPTFVKSLAMVPVGRDHPIAAIGAYWGVLHEPTIKELSTLEALADLTHEAIERVGPFDDSDGPVAAAGFGSGSLDPVERAGAPLTLSEDHERIARDLHDTVVQRLFGIGLQLQALRTKASNEPLEEKLQTIVGEVDTTIRELRGVVFGLEYGHTRFGGLQGEILTLAAESTRTLGFAPTVRFAGRLDEVEESLRFDVISALREMLSNVSRHANASAVVIDLSADSRLVLKVFDDGIGLPEKARRGNGLANMAERAKGLGGSFDLAPRPSAGVVATWSVPLP